MEAAGWQLARRCPPATAVVCGKGNNAGDGLAAARHLHRWGKLASVSCADRKGLSGPAAREAAALEAAGVHVSPDLDLAGADAVLDALFGTGLSRPPAGVYAEWILAINAAGRRVIAADVPSGLEADSGRALAPAIRADLTVTLGLPKRGLLTGAGPALAGEVWVADIGIPDQAYADLGLEVPAHLFAAQDAILLASTVA